MKLTRFSVQGYRRFQERCTLDTDDRLVALVGPNEAGKSSILRALWYLNSETPIAERDRTFDAGTPCELRAKFSIDDADRAELAELYGAEAIRSLFVTKSADGNRTFGVDVTLKRSPAPRMFALAAVESVKRLLPEFTTASEPDSPWSRLRIEKLQKNLSNWEIDTILGKDLKLIDESCSVFEEILPWATMETNDGASNTEVSEAVTRAVEALRRALENERSPHPHETAVEILRKRLPQFVQVTPDDLDLRHSYTFDELGSPNRALLNLAALAHLDLPRLHTALVSNDATAIERLLDAAHKHLAHAFSRDRWRQAALEVRLRNTASDVRLMIRNADDDSFAYLNERSDGLRRFVALVAILEQRSHDRRVVLLIDEAEQH